MSLGSATCVCLEQFQCSRAREPTFRKSSPPLLHLYLQLEFYSIFTTPFVFELT